MFKDLNKGALVHIVDSTNIPVYFQGVLSEMSLPYTPQPQPGQQFNPMFQVVDMTVQVNGNNQIFKGIPYMSDVATHAGMTVSCSQSSLKTVVESIYRKSLDAIQNVDKHRNTITACESILEQIDPGVAQSKAQEKKIADLQNEIYQLKKDMPTLEDIKTLFMQSMNSSTNNVKKDK